MPDRWPLVVGDRVEVSIQFRDRRLALAGRGHVPPVQPLPATRQGTWVEVEWFDGHPDLRAAALDSGWGFAPSWSPLTAGLELPAPVSTPPAPSLPPPAPADATADLLKTVPDLRPLSELSAEALRALAAAGADLGPTESLGPDAGPEPDAAPGLPETSAPPALRGPSTPCGPSPPYGSPAPYRRSVPHGPSAPSAPYGPDVRPAYATGDAAESGEVTPLARIELVRLEKGVEGPEASRSGLETGPPVLEPKGRRVLGVDFGTGATRVATFDDATGFEPVLTRRGRPSLPSVVHAEPRGKTFVGEPAVRRSDEAPRFGLRDFRRLMGRAYAAPQTQALVRGRPFRVVEGPQGETAAALDDLVVPLEAVAGVLFKEVREASSLFLQDRANRAVVTVPGWSGPQLRDSCRLAAEFGGFHVERVVGEAAAVALDHGQSRSVARGTALVVSLGAGLLDLAVAHFETGQVRVGAVGGSFEVGGVDFDAALEPAIVEAVEDATGERPAETPDFWARLMVTARRTKEALSEARVATSDLVQPLPSGEAFRLDVEVPREQAEAAWSPLIARVLEEVEALLERAQYDHIDLLIAAGGQMQTPALRAALQSRLPSAQWVDADEAAAARGAACLGHRCAQGRHPGLIEPAPRALAVAARRGGAQLAFPAGVPMPESRELTLPAAAGELILLQAPFDGHWTAVGRLDVTTSGAVDLKLRLSLAADGQLDISAEGGGADWRPVPLLPLSARDRETPWWAAQAVRGGAADEADDAARGFVGWLKKRLGGPNRADP